MPTSSKSPPELLDICARWSKSFEKFTDNAARIDFVRNELPALLGSRSLFIGILRSITRGATYPDLRQAMIFEDEMILYLQPQRLFSLRMFIYGPEDFTPVHDHTSWGVSGSALGDLSVVKYRRDDDGLQDGYARLRRMEQLTLKPGETDVTLPLNQGIHQTGNSTAATIIMISVYGRPLRRLYINRFDIENNRVYKMFPPRMKKRRLAQQALEIMENSAG
ncbi:MAG: hypothetical protein JSW39_29050 [Desulfobacterales bacterium]|nr:MAG: hypothetical protein JSW39_29050 [Desulfobacterales bacterium]